MKLSNNQIAIATSAGVCSLAVSVLVASGNISIKLFSLAGLLAVPPSAIAFICLDNRAQSKINAVQRKLSDAVTEGNQVKSKLSAEESRTARLQTELTTLQQSFNRAKEVLKACEEERCQSALNINQLNQSVSELQSSLVIAQTRVEELEAECEEWEKEFHTRIDLEADKRFQVAKKAEIQQIESENDEITREAIEIARSFRQWAMQVDERLQDRGEYIKGVTNAYNNHLDGLKGSVSRQIEEYLKQIEILNNKVAMLQQKLAGDLVEPKYLECGFDPNGKIANAIAEWVWNHRRIPLQVAGFETSADGVVTAGYIYSRSTTTEALSKAIEGDSSLIARNLGLYSIEKPQKLSVADVLTVKIRRERPARKTGKGDLYRSKEEFIKYILTQPVRLRIVGEPGAGKTPTVAVLLSHILKRGFLEANTPNGRKLPYCIVESCNPLAGVSVKNGDELDFCLKWNSGAKGFKGLAEEYRFRKNPVNAEYKNSVGYIWVADEIDNSMADLSKDEAKPFKDSLKDGGHVNLGVIVMGQSANISTSKGLSIDDQKMMTNIYIDPVSIRTFLTQYGERFYSKKAVEKALATLEELELEIEERNEVICDTAREFRIAMVTANRSPVFYQLPYFDSVEIDRNSYQETLAKVLEIREGRGETHSDAGVSADLLDSAMVMLSACPDPSRRSPSVGLETRRDTSDKPICPHCGSDQIRSKGTSWLCQNSEHLILAPDKPKSWKK